MQVNIFDVVGPGRKIFRAHCDLAECFPDDEDGRAQAEREILASGQAWFGGGAAPAVILEPIPPRDLKVPPRAAARDELPTLHADLVARLAAIRAPRVPVDVDPEDLIEIGTYESAVLEAVRAHFGEVARCAGMNGAGNLDPVIGDADAKFHDLQSDFSGRMNSAAADMRGE